MEHDRLYVIMLECGRYLLAIDLYLLLFILLHNGITDFWNTDNALSVCLSIYRSVWAQCQLVVWVFVCVFVCAHVHVFVLLCARQPCAMLWCCCCSNHLSIYLLGFLLSNHLSIYWCLGELSLLNTTYYNSIPQASTCLVK